MLARGQQESKPFDNLLAFQPCIFMNPLSILMGISDSGTYNFVPNKRSPIFSFF